MSLYLCVRLHDCVCASARVCACADRCGEQEGVDALAAWGTRVVKLAMTQPAANYPWNSDWPSVWAAPVSMARHPYCERAAPGLPGEGFGRVLVLVFSCRRICESEH